MRSRPREETKEARPLSGKLMYCASNFNASSSRSSPPISTRTLARVQSDMLELDGPQWRSRSARLKADYEDLLHGKIQVQRRIFQLEERKKTLRSERFRAKYEDELRRRKLLFQSEERDRERERRAQSARAASDAPEGGGVRKPKKGGTNKGVTLADPAAASSPGGASEPPEAAPPPAPTDAENRAKLKMLRAKRRSTMMAKGVAAAALAGKRAWEISNKEAQDGGGVRSGRLAKAQMRPPREVQGVVVLPHGLGAADLKPPMRRKVQSARRALRQTIQTYANAHSEASPRKAGKGGKQRPASAGPGRDPARSGVENFAHWGFRKTAVPSAKSKRRPRPHSSPPKGSVSPERRGASSGAAGKAAGGGVAAGKGKRAASARGGRGKKGANASLCSEEAAQGVLQLGNGWKRCPPALFDVSNMGEIHFRIQALQDQGAKPGHNDLTNPEPDILARP